jgi:hypothetical protein
MLGLIVVCINIFVPLIFSGYLAMRFKNWSKSRVALAASFPIPGLIWVGELIFISLWAYSKYPSSCGHHSCKEDIISANFVSIMEFLFFILTFIFSYLVAVYVRRNNRPSIIKDTFR